MKKLVILVSGLILFGLSAFAQSVTYSDTLYSDGAGNEYWCDPSPDNKSFALENDMKVRYVNFHFTNMKNFNGQQLSHGKKAVIFSPEVEEILKSMKDKDDFFCNGLIFLFKKSDAVAVGDISNKEWLDDGVEGWITSCDPGKFRVNNGDKIQMKDSRY